HTRRQKLLAAAGERHAPTADPPSHRRGAHARVRLHIARPKTDQMRDLPDLRLQNPAAPTSARPGGWGEPPGHPARLRSLASRRPAFRIRRSGGDAGRGRRAAHAREPPGDARRSGHTVQTFQSLELALETAQSLGPDHYVIERARRADLEPAKTIAA